MTYERVQVATCNETAMSLAKEDASVAVDKDSKSKRKIWVWGLIILCFALSTATVALLTGFSNGITVIAFLVGCISAPLHLLVSANAAFLYFSFAAPSSLPGAAVLPVDQYPLSSSFIMYVLFNSSFGVASGLALILDTKFLPVGVQAPITRAALGALSIIDYIIDMFVPPVMQRALGWPFTIVSELLMVPVAMVMLAGCAQLKYSGECLDEKHGNWSIGSWSLLSIVPNFLHRSKVQSRSTTQKAPVLIIMIHGNGFNQCQWLFAKFCMRSRAWGSDGTVQYLSIDMFSGPLRRAHTKDTNTIKTCAMVAAGKISSEIKSRGLEPKRVVLFGHSLGGVVSCYINENLAQAASLPDDRHVVSWSAPLIGSDLLLWAKQNKGVLEKRFGWFMPKFKDIAMAGTIRDEFCPLAKAHADLRMQMCENGRSYFAITGHCDHLVRPHSACPSSSFAASNSHVLPHVGHFNIKISVATMRVVMEHLETTGKVSYPTRAFCATKLD